MFSKDTKASTTATTATTPATPATPIGANGAGAKTTGIPSIISPDLKIVGDLKSHGDIQIDGTIEGDINSRLLTVGEQAELATEKIGSIVERVASLRASPRRAAKQGRPKRKAKRKRSG